MKEDKTKANPYNIDGFLPPKFQPQTEKPITETITISVAEYHCLTKAAALLEIILAAKTYSVEAVVNAVRETVKGMVQQAEAGAAE